MLKILCDGEEIGSIVTNRALSIVECLDLLGIDVNELDGGGNDLIWDINSFEMKYD